MEIYGSVLRFAGLSYALPQRGTFGDWVTKYRSDSPGLGQHTPGRPKDFANGKPLIQGSTNRHDVVYIVLVIPTTCTSSKDAVLVLVSCDLLVEYVRPMVVPPLGASISDAIDKSVGPSSFRRLSHATV